MPVKRLDGVTYDALLDAFLEMMECDWREEEIDIEIGTEWECIIVSDNHGHSFVLTADWMNKWEKNRVELTASRLLTMSVSKIESFIKKTGLQLKKLM